MEELNPATLISFMVIGVTALSKGFDLAMAAIQKARKNGVPSLREQQQKDISKIKQVLIEGSPGSPSLVSQVQMNTKLLSDHLIESRERRKK